MARRDWVGRDARCASLGSDWHRRVELFSGRWGGSLLFGLLGLVSVEPSFEQGDGGAEVVVECEQQVDVVEVFLAGEAVGEVVAWGFTVSTFFGLTPFMSKELETMREPSFIFSSCGISLTLRSGNK